MDARAPVKVIAIVQARMNSSRCPGKILFEAAGKPLLQYILERLLHCPVLDGVVVATSALPSDDPIAAFCSRYGTPSFRGSLDNVASRFDALAASGQCDAFVRVNGDSPFLDQGLIMNAVEVYRNDRPDLVSNVFPTRSFPKGQSVEVVDGPAFRLAYRKMSDPGDLEHVTRYLHRNSAEFRISAIRGEIDGSGANMAVDSPGDLRWFSAVVDRMDKPHWTYGWREALRLMELAPAVDSQGGS